MGGEERANVLAVLESDFLNDGDVTTEFERKLAGVMGVKHAVAVTSGTAALYLGLKAVGVGPGDEVVVPDLTFIATANAVQMAGATPVLADVDESTLTLSGASLEKAVTRSTRAVIPVHVSGRPADVKGIAAVAARHGLRIVEDAAEALCSFASGRALGSLGDAGCFSFSPNKTITTGQGGLVVTNDDGVHARLRAFKDQGRPVRGTGGADVHPTVGYNFKFTNLQAAVGLGQLELLRSRIERQRAIHRLYRSALADCPGIRLPPFDLEGGATPQWTDAVVDERDALHDHLLANGAECRKFWFPLHTQAPYRLPDDKFPTSTRVGPKALWLPSAFTLTDGQIEFVCDRIRDFQRTRRAASRAL
jgi:perosamine synthetase